MRRADGLHVTGLSTTGSAAKGIARRLEQHGYRLVAERESFFVTVKNQLQDGQTDHAAEWGPALAELAAARAARATDGEG